MKMLLTYVKGVHNNSINRQMLYLESSQERDRTGAIHRERCANTPHNEEAIRTLKHPELRVAKGIGLLIHRNPKPIDDIEM